WVVLVLRTADLLDCLTFEAIERWQSVGDRFLVLALDDGRHRRVDVRSAAPGGVQQYDALDERWLSEVGIDYRGSIVETDCLAVELARIRTEQRPVLLSVRVADEEPGPSLENGDPTPP